jgi:hypothetical protein
MDIVFVNRTECAVAGALGAAAFLLQAMCPWLLTHARGGGFA